MRDLTSSLSFSSSDPASSHHVFDPATLDVFPVPTKATVVGERWFYRFYQEWIGIVERLGTLSGFDDSSPLRRTIRARRFYCNTRRQQPGCGRTFSIRLADKIRRLSITTSSLWTFLQLAVVVVIATAIKAINCPRSERTF
ncbi:MAG: hypothetical protein C0467_30150, partial [Planctomycetaceae bacterium]|nr:hypothetical protein [Planctomycetaceae bacterium]